MDKIIIQDLAVQYRVGVTDEERAQPQKLLVTVEMELDFSRAAINDELAYTCDYFAVSQELLRYGENRSWKLIERLAVEMAAMIMRDFKPQRVTIEIKKFVIPEAAHVAVRITRPTALADGNTTRMVRNF
jgi:dihydroneopterin aldolase